MRRRFRSLVWISQVNPKYPKPRTFVSQVIPSIHEHLCGVNTQKHVCSGEFGPGVPRGSVEGVFFEVAAEAAPITFDVGWAGCRVGEARVGFGLAADHGIFHVDAAEVGDLEEHDL